MKKVGAQARVVCANASKRLCSEAEWSGACRGARDTLYPYGNARQRGRRNDRFHESSEHPVQRLFRAYSAKGEDPRDMWQPLWMNDARCMSCRGRSAPPAPSASARTSSACSTWSATYTTGSTIGVACSPAAISWTPTRTVKAASTAVEQLAG